MSRTTLILELEIDGDPQDAVDVLEFLLDQGAIQAQINEHDMADAGPLVVVSAVVAGTR